MSKSESQEERRIHLVASDTIQSHCFVELLQQHAATTLHTQLKEALALICLGGDEPTAVLIDVSCFALDSVLEQVSAVNLPQNAYPALLNVDRREQSVADSVAYGVRGIFFEDDPIEKVTRGVRALLDGAVWISRETLFHAARHPGHQHVSNGAIRVAERLTRREREIVGLICIGATNKEIADRLFISTNTVKTHVYKIYKKINVPNRMQAALWGAKHL